jgi:hypothetical protein
MFARRSALVVSLAILVVGCSSGGGKQSTPTTSRQLTLGPCPKTAPLTDVTKLNAGVKGLGRVLVPITALRVRLCQYGNNGRLDAERTLVSSEAVGFEADANSALPVRPTTTAPPYSPSGNQGLVGDDCLGDVPRTVTFANDSQRVDLQPTCYGESNGVLVAVPTERWYSELVQDTTPLDGFAEGEMHIQGGPPTKGRKPHDQPLPGVVEIHSFAKHPTWVKIGVTGRFKIRLPVGNYVLVGRPSNKGIMAMTSKTFTIEDGRTVHVDLLELAT